MPDRIAIGNVEVIALLDVVMEFPWNVPFPKNDPSDFEPYRELYPGAFGQGMYRTNAQAYIIRSQGKTLLCDTALGPGPIAWLGGAKGNLVPNMQSKGVQPEDIDLVFHTHLHSDHVGWNVASNGSPTFPNATYYAPQADFDTFNAAPQANPHMQQQVTPLKDLGKLELYSEQRSLTPEVTIVPTPGHTPGHSSLVVSSSGEKALITGDLAHHPAQLDHLEWACGFDHDPALGVQSRTRMIERADSEGMTAVFCHFPHPGFGRVIKSNGRRVFQAL